MIPVLEFESVSKSFKHGVPVLDSVSFRMAEGEVVGLIGRNGAGKTTLIRIAMGMIYPRGGVVRVFGVSPTEHPVAVKMRIGYVSEDQVLPSGSSIGELIAFHRYLYPSWDETLERQLLDRFALSTGAKIRHLSKGQARQVALLCAVCHRPELLILDEPAAGLDPAARREFLETSIQLLNREGTAILFSSHQMGDIERIGGRIVLLGHGKVRLDSEIASLGEDICIAMLPRTAAADVAAIERIAGCLRVRLVFDTWHAVVRGTPESAKQRIETALNITGVNCAAVPLEELFIELVGGERA
jgi:ABC-2 type transport system ATP-binding protein